MPPRTRARLSPAVGLFIGACGVGIYQFYFLAGYGFNRGHVMIAIARRLAAHGAYANPFLPVLTGPTALVPPIHPIFLAALIAVFGRLPCDGVCRGSG